MLATDTNLKSPLTKLLEILQVNVTLSKILSKCKIFDCNLLNR